MRNDKERYGQFLDHVSNGEVKLNTGTLTPYEIITPILLRRIDEAERKSINATWCALEDFGNGENALAVIDGSSSMYCSSQPVPEAVALSLGIYFAQRNRGAFKNRFITFSENPRLVEIKGGDIVDKRLYRIRPFSRCCNRSVKLRR